MKVTDIKVLSGLQKRKSQPPSVSTHSLISPTPTQQRRKAEKQTKEYNDQILSMMQTIMQDNFKKFDQKLEKMEANMQAMKSNIDKVSGHVNEIR